MEGESSNSTQGDNSQGCCLQGDIEDMRPHLYVSLAGKVMNQVAQARLVSSRLRPGSETLRLVGFQALASAQEVDSGKPLNSC